MYRFLISPRWLGFHALVLIGIIAFINFGFWQLDRLDQRRDFNRTVVARIDQAPVPLDTVTTELASGVQPDQFEWRSVDTAGRYLSDEEFLVVNRSQGGRAGDNVVTPLLLSDDTVLFVNRGFVPLGEEVPGAPAGQVTVRGVVRVSEERRRGQLSDPSEGTLREVQRIDIDRLRNQMPARVLPFYIDLSASQPPQTTIFPEPVTRPNLSEGSHLSYAAQWFIFATAIAVGWVLAVRHSIGRHRRSLIAASVADRPSPDDDEATTAPQRTAPPSST
jgi:cytochrome oxidase assembly protein ShyY1